MPPKGFAQLINVIENIKQRFFARPFWQKNWWKVLLPISGVLVMVFVTSQLIQAPGCPKYLSGVFTNSFVDPDKILAARPLGYTTGMDHILPVDHTEFTFKAAVDEKIPVYAPTQITINQISNHTDYRADGTRSTNQSNYMYEFEICGNAITGWMEF